jgi:signal transduction histidine kinase
MSLRQRVVLTLAVITAILVVPAVYAVVSLRELRGIADQLHSRDADALLALGELQRASAEADRLAQVYVVFYEDPRGPGVRAQNDSALRQVDAALAQLRTHPAYRRETSEASRQWRLIEQLIATERDMLARTDTGQQRVFRDTAIVPAVARMDSLLTPIADAITRTGTVAVDQAKSVAGTASNTTWLALACALALTVLIGSWLTRGLLRPIEELRRGMAHVAQGDLEPNVRVPKERPDELGDLARSFSTMTEQLAELDRLKAEFVSVASHEIKTPLSVIRGYVSLLADGIYGAVNEAQQKTLSSVSDQVDRLTRLVHRLLDISRFEAGGGRLEIRRINVRDFADELTDGFRVLAMQNGIDFAVRIADDVPVNIEGDADRLNEVLGNLLSNAFKFTPQGGTIRVEACRNGAGVVVEVEDTGVGIPPEKLPKIFEKFYQVENDAQPRSVGSGLGLAIAREIVEAHGGTIGAESRVGEGTKFTVTLPERPPVHRMPESHPTQERR